MSHKHFNDEELQDTRLTPQEIRSVKDYQNLTDEEVQEIIDTIFTLANIILDQNGTE